MGERDRALRLRLLRQRRPRARAAGRGRLARGGRRGLARPAGHRGRGQLRRARSPRRSRARRRSPPDLPAVARLAQRASRRSRWPGATSGPTCRCCSTRWPSPTTWPTGWRPPSGSTCSTSPAADWLPAVLAALAPLGIAPPAPAPAPPEPLAGREREQALLRERLAAALAGRGALVLIGGEAGIGKTDAGRGAAGRGDGAGRAGAGRALLRPGGDAALRPLARGPRAYAAAARPAAAARRRRPTAAALAAVASQAALFAAGARLARRARRPPARWSCCWTTCTGPTPPRLDLLRVLARRARRPAAAPARHLPRATS